MYGVRNLAGFPYITDKVIATNHSTLQFWGPGNFELFLLSTAMHRGKYMTSFIT